MNSVTPPITHVAEAPGQTTGPEKINQSPLAPSKTDHGAATAASMNRLRRLDATMPDSLRVPAGPGSRPGGSHNQPSAIVIRNSALDFTFFSRLLSSSIASTTFMSASTLRRR